MDFTKLHGTGNDFIVIDARGLDRDWRALATAMCDRHFGAGADGLILALPSERANVRMRIFNADGSEAEMSGNGMRCLVKFAVEASLVARQDDDFAVETGAGILPVQIEMSGDRVVRVREGMGQPRLDPREIPVAIEAPGPVLRHSIQVEGRAIEFTPVSMGNPHAVHFQDAPVEAYPLHDVGPRVEHHPLFPNRANFEVVRITGPGTAEMRVWERGVGETLSCGSGASAVMVAARLRGLVGDTLELRVPGGVLDLAWDGAGEVVLTGSVVEVFRGVWPD